MWYILPYNFRRKLYLDNCVKIYELADFIHATPDFDRFINLARILL